MVTVLSDSNYWVIALQIANQSSRQRGRPTETGSKIFDSNIPTGSNIWSQVPQRRSTPRHTDWLTVSRKVTSNFETRKCRDRITWEFAVAVSQFEWNRRRPARKHRSWGIHGAEISRQATNGEDIALWEQLACAVIIYKVCKATRPLRLLVLKKKWSYPRNGPRRPIGLWDVEDPTLSRQSIHRWR
jgi:hypothetical protein